MGEMSVRSRPRRDIVASFNRLRRMVIDVKSARKSLAAHHSLVAELVSVSLYPPLRDTLSCTQLDNPQEESPLSVALSPLSFPANPLDRTRSVPLLLNHTQDVGTELQDVGIVLNNSVHSSFASSKKRRRTSFLSLRSLTSKISASLSSSAEGSDLLCISAACQERESSSGRVLKPAAHPSKRLSQPAFWASLFMVFCCFFLCTGKEIAVFVAIGAYTIVWFIHRLRTIIRQVCVNRHSSCYDEDDVQDGQDSNHMQDRQGHNPFRSSTISQDTKCVRSRSADFQVPMRSQSLSNPHFNLGEGGCSTERSPSLYDKSSGVTSSNSGNLPARIRLGLILIMVLCGLAYGQIAAVCMCSCCIVILRFTQGLPLRKIGASNSTKQSQN